MDFERARADMVARQMAGRGVRDERVLQAFRTVPRHEFVPPGMLEFAHHDAPLPIAEGQTISQPYVVALMVEALDLEPEDRVLEVGAGSGYAAAILGQLAREVHAVERHAALVDDARVRMHVLGYDNVHVHLGDGTLGLESEAPFDAIVVAAGGPRVPQPLLSQLALGGRLVIPVGDRASQRLVRVTRRSEDDYREEDLGEVRFVPLVGEEGWSDEVPQLPVPAPFPQEGQRPAPRSLARLVREGCEPFEDLEEADLTPLLERIGEARVVLLGEASHGTSEFYRMRARITRELIVRKGFDVVAVEADWPDARQVDLYARGVAVPWTAFARFPTWMWRNEEVRSFVRWLRAHNLGEHGTRGQVGFFGLDVYSLYTSIGAVLDYLDRVDPEAARVARHRYGCLTPYQKDPVTYGRAVLSGRYRDCESEVAAVMQDLLRQRLESDEHLDAVQNARVAAAAERYYRVMYYGAAESWNLRDTHMFETLQHLVGTSRRAVVWAHNSHLGNARYTEMSARGEINLGQLCRERYGSACYAVGFGTHEGTVAAATDWDGEMEIKTVRASHPDSYERVCHDSGVPNFLLPLRNPHDLQVRSRLLKPRLERAIGVIYRPDTELLSHYFDAILPQQFDEWIWFDRTRAVTPLERTAQRRAVPATYPFGE